jgi:hypothetical protein
MLLLLHKRLADKDVHDFALSEKIEPSEFEEVIYELLTSFFNAGKSKEVKVDVSKELLEKEIEVEMEHTTCKIIAEKIVRDHLAENEKYYEFLDKMENEMKNSEQK